MVWVCVFCFDCFSVFFWLVAILVQNPWLLLLMLLICEMGIQFSCVHLNFELRKSQFSFAKCSNTHFSSVLCSFAYQSNNSSYIRLRRNLSCYWFWGFASHRVKYYEDTVFHYVGWEMGHVL